MIKLKLLLIGILWLLVFPMAVMVSLKLGSLIALSLGALTAMIMAAGSDRRRF